MRLFFVLPAKEKAGYIERKKNSIKILITTACTKPAQIVWEKVG
jgi:hypothetical protein